MKPGLAGNPSTVPLVGGSPAQALMQPNSSGNLVQPSPRRTSTPLVANSPTGLGLPGSDRYGQGSPVASHPYASPMHASSPYMSGGRQDSYGAVNGQLNGLSRPSPHPANRSPEGGIASTPAFDGMQQGEPPRRKGGILDILLCRCG